MTGASSDIMVFDRERIAHNRKRASKHFSNHDFLFQWAHKHLLDRLSDVNRTFETAIHIGNRCPVTGNDHDKIEKSFTLDLNNDKHTNIVASEEFLPLAAQSIDLLTSTLSLHGVNDLPGTLLQIRQALKKDGLFLATMLGGETLHELRTVMTDVELELYGGISPRIFPFADKPQMGDLLQRAGYALPVVDSDVITVTYDSVFKLFQDIRGMGEGNAIRARSKTPLGKQFFMRIAEEYHARHAEEDGRIVASFEIIFLLGWAPHASQQKPLKPGSAKHRLADILGTKEQSTGEKAKP